MCTSVSFAHIQSCVAFGGGPWTLLTIGNWRPSNCVRVPICGSDKFLYYKALDFKFLVTSEVKLKKKTYLYIEGILLYC